MIGKVSKLLWPKKRCSYFAKFYRGVPVLTLADMEKATRVSRYYYLNCMKQNRSKFLKGIDYWYLKDGLLLDYFDENPLVSRKKSKELIVTGEGILKLRAIVQRGKEVKAP